jgi:hypothetical protein
MRRLASHGRAPRASLQLQNSASRRGHCQMRHDKFALNRGGRTLAACSVRAVNRCAKKIVDRRSRIAGRRPLSRARTCFATPHRRRSSSLRRRRLRNGCEPHAHIAMRGASPKGRYGSLKAKAPAIGASPARTHQVRERAIAAQTGSAFALATARGCTIVAARVQKHANDVGSAVNTGTDRVTCSHAAPQPSFSRPPRAEERAPTKLRTSTRVAN